MYLQGIDKQGLPGIGPLPGAASEPDATEGKTTDSRSQVPEQRTEADDMIEKIYSNMSACHLKNSNWRRALDCAERVSVERDFSSAFTCLE